VPRPFVLFGADHLGALIATALAAAASAALVRRRPHGHAAVGARLGLSLALFGATAATLVRWSRDAPLTVWDVLPLHLCDFLLVVAVAALLTLHPLACELLYFWGCAGTLLAVLTPDVRVGFPDWQFLSFFVLHGLIVVAAVTVVAGFGRRPRPRAAWRAFALTNAYAAVVAAVNAVFGTNYLYLCRKPGAATLLDWLGPWPIYIVAADALALALFLLLELPFRAAPPRPGAALAPPDGARLD
jgi:hypothetical integral membrane protein (TIGR02206 family)